MQLVVGRSILGDYLAEEFLAEEEVMNGDCPTCQDHGIYMDIKCRDKTCAHCQRRVLEWKTMRVKTQFGYRYKDYPSKLGKPAMQCPIRTCMCAAGRKQKALVKKKAKKTTKRKRSKKK